MCLKVIDPAMDAVGRIKGWKAGFCSELKEPVGAHRPQREPRETLTYRDSKGTLNTHLSEVTTARKYLHTLPPYHLHRRLMFSDTLS